MDGSTIVNNIITGIIAGVSAGLILAAFSFAKQHIDHRMERRDQIKYIRQIVEDFQERVLSAEEVRTHPTAPKIDNMPSVHEFRWVSLKHTYERVVNTLEGRADSLTFDEKKQLLDAFGWYIVLRPGGGLGDSGLLVGEAQYHQMFDELEAIEWLNIREIDRTRLGPRP